MAVWGPCPQWVGLGTVPQWGPEAKPLVGCEGFAPQKLTSLFRENMAFYHGFKNDMAIPAFTAYKCSIRNGRNINLDAEMW